MIDWLIFEFWAFRPYWPFHALVVLFYTKLWIFYSLAKRSMFRRKWNKNAGIGKLYLWPLNVPEVISGHEEKWPNQYHYDYRRFFFLEFHYYVPPPTRATITATIGELIHAFILFPDNRHLSSTRCIGVLKCDWKGRSIWWNSVKTVHHHLTEVPVKLTSLSLFIRYQWWTVGGVWEVVGDDSFALRKASYAFKTFLFLLVLL